MRAKEIFIYIIVIIFLSIIINLVYAVTPKYATKSHKIITRDAIEYFKNKDSALGVITNDDLIQLQNGAEAEDSYLRFLNHYYDYFHRDKNGGGYLYLKPSSKEWAHKQEGLIFGGSNTWEEAIQKFKYGERAEAFYALGHIIHLIQDMCVPTHTRNDTHIVGTFDYYYHYSQEYENYIYNNYTKDFLSGSSTKDLGSLDEYFDKLSEFTQRNFYSSGTVFSTNFSEDGSMSTIFPSVSRYGDGGGDVLGETFYYAYGNGPPGSGEIHLAYRAFIFPISKKEIYSAEHPEIYKDTWKIAGKLAMEATAGVVKLFLNEVSTTSTPGTISVSPSSGSWTTTPQNLTVSSSNSTIIYYTMVNTTDGSAPSDPREPTSSDYDGTISVSGGAGTFQLYGAAGQNKRSKLRFRGYNGAGAGPASVVFLYTIDLSPVTPTPGAISVSPSSGSWTTTPQNLTVSSSNSTIIYYTMVKTYDGSTPEDPREPKWGDNDGAISGPNGVYQLYGTPGDHTVAKLRFSGYNQISGVSGPASGVYSYSINLSSGLPNNAEFNGQIDALSSYIFYSDNTLAYRFNNSSSSPVTYSVIVSPGKYRIFSVLMQGNTQEQGYAVYDQQGNNVFELANGAVVTIGSSVPNSTDGRVVKNITGSNYTGTYDPPLDLSGVWDTTESITVSTDPGYPVGSVTIAVDNITQTGNRVDRYNSTTQMMFTGCINGKVIYVSKAFNAWGWDNKYTETMVVNEAGNYMTGTNQQTGTAFLSPGYIIASNVVRTKRP